jgi:enoyl-CoA hydratase/carnithine racemase
VPEATVLARPGRAHAAKLILAGELITGAQAESLDSVH